MCCSFLSFLEELSTLLFLSLPSHSLHSPLQFGFLSNTSQKTALWPLTLSTGVQDFSTAFDRAVCSPAKPSHHLLFLTFHSSGVSSVAPLVSLPPAAPQTSVFPRFLSCQSLAEGKYKRWLSICSLTPDCLGVNPSSATSIPGQVFKLFVSQFPARWRNNHSTQVTGGL